MDSVTPDAVTVETTIDAPVEIVWRFLTAERRTWWPQMRFDAAVGAPLIETWTDEGRTATATGTVTRCTAPHVLGFAWTEPGWLHPLEVIIELSPDGPATAITLTESGFSPAPHPSPSLAAEHEEGWRYHLARLKRVSEGDAVDILAE